jgi:hypothetical protein
MVTTMSRTLTQTTPTEPSWLSRVKRVDEERAKEEDEGLGSGTGSGTETGGEMWRAKGEPSATDGSDRTLEEGRERVELDRKRNDEQKATERAVIEEGKEEKGLTSQPRVWKEGHKVVPIVFS